MSRATLDLLAEARQRGYSIIPCGSGSDKKGPLCRWADFQHRRASEDELAAWRRKNPATWALVTGEVSGIAIVDFDGSEGMKTLKSWSIEPNVLTPRGGAHVYVKHPGFRVATLNSKGAKELGTRFPGVDIKGDGGYAIFCGRSSHGEYNCRSLEPYDWSDLPKDFRQFLESRNEDAVTIASAGPERSLADVILHKYIREATEGNRNCTGFELACQLRDKGIPQPEAESRLLEYARSVPGSGYTVAEALASVRQAYSRQAREPWSSAGAVPETSRKPTDFPLTDLGNAERLIAAYGEGLRFDVDSGKWLIWTGKRWEYDYTGQIFRRAAKVIRGLYKKLPQLDKTQADAVYKHIKTSESQPRLAAMVNLAEKLEGVAVRTSELDQDPWLLNCLNGTLDLRTGTLRPHCREDLITRLVPVEYYPHAAAPRWERFLREVFRQDAELISFVQRTAGYCLTGSTREQCIFVLYGKGSNGKSVFTETLRRVLGDYAGSTPVATFTDRRESNTADLASLVGKRLVTATEAEDGHAFAESLLKTVTGGDPVTCRHLYREHFTYTPQFKVLISTNSVPYVRSQDYAMMRRFKLIPFRQRFWAARDGREPVRDEGLLDKLLAEKGGILAWAVQGCLDWQRTGLAEPDSVRAEVEGYFDACDPLGEFIESECILQPGARTATADLWRAYCSWCESQGREPAFKDIRWFSRNLTKRDGIDTRKGVDGVRELTGIALMALNGVKTPFLQNSPVKDESENFCKKPEMTPFNAIPEREKHVADTPGERSDDSVYDSEDNARPLAETDSAGVESIARDLLNWGSDHGWPRLPLRSGTALAEGEQNWLHFAEAASRESLEEARTAASKWIEEDEL